MAGQPITNMAMRKFADAGLENILDRVIDGDHLQEIADELFVSRPMLVRWLNGYIGPAGEPDSAAQARRRAYREARALSAQLLAEDALKGVDDEDDPKAAYLAKVKADFRFRLAEVYSEDFRPAKQGNSPTININIAQLHIDSLRRRQLPRPAEQIHDAEVLAIEPAAPAESEA